MKRRAKTDKTTRLRRLVRPTLASVWIFPLGLLVLLCLATSLRISGTSVGVFHQLLNGSSAPDSALLRGTPQPIRSDEWLTNTQLVVAQAASGFPRINPNIQDGRDMSVVVDVPYLDWSIAFKPQNLIFFVLPLEYAFAFKWWLLVFSLAVGTYFLTLRFIPGRRLFAALFATAFSIAPFVMWWYQTITVAPLIYGVLISIIGMRIINGEKLPFLKAKRQLHSNVVYIIALSYLLGCFGLVFYPPFQIPIMLVVGAFLLGHLLHTRQIESLSFKQLLQRTWPLIAGAVVGLAIVAAFVITRHEAIHAIQNTVYPGERSVASGGAKAVEVLGSFMQYQIQRPERAVHFYNNQSEVSNFILFLPFLLLPSLLLIASDIRKRAIDWRLTAVTGIGLLLLARMYIPHLDIVSKALFLQPIPHNRLLIGLGFAGVLQLLILIPRLMKLRYSPKIIILIGVYLAGCTGVLILVGSYTRNTWPQFISSWPLLLLLIGAYMSILALFLYKRILLAAGLLLVFTLVSVQKIQPLYTGLGILTNSPVQTAMRNVSDKDDTWAVADNIYFENFAVISDRDSVSGIQFYPDTDFWTNVEAGERNRIFNRYAHIVYNSSPTLTENVRLVQADFVQVTLRCDDFTRKNVDYVLSTEQLSRQCLDDVQVLQYPKVNLYIYKVQTR